MGCAVAGKAVVALVAAAAVGSGGSAAAAPAPSAAAPVQPVFAPVPSVSATRIVLERTGGFAGLRQEFVVNRSTVGGRQVLRLAASADFGRLRRSYQPANACCDRFFYRLTVTYRSAPRKTVTTVQGAAAPAVLWKVISLTERVGAGS